MVEILVYGFMIFYICSFVGYFMEVFWVFLGSKKIVNRGFLCGPVIPIYGFGALLILLTLFRYYEDPVVVFVFGVIITSALEYFVSFLLEKIFHNKWWDYSSEKFWMILALILFILIVLDTIYSVVIAYNLRNRIIIVEELKNEKIAMIPVIFEKRLKESIEGFKAFPNRLLKAFPDLENKNHKSFEIMKAYREQLKKRQKENKKKKTNKKSSK